MSKAAAVVLVLVLASATPAALGPDQIALVVNAKVPASRELAAFYAQKRHIPAGRIIALDLPFPDEEIPFEQYNSAVVPAVRKYLQDNDLRERVTCLVTFWGVPLRIGRRINTPEQQKELVIIQQETQRTQAELEAAVATAEALAREVTGSFQARQGKDVAQLAGRASDALSAALNAIARMGPGDLRNGLFRRLRRLVEQVSGPSGAYARLAQPGIAELWPEPVDPKEVAAVARKAEQARHDLAAAEAAPASPESLARMRQTVSENFGLFQSLALLQAQLQKYETKETDSAFDSELAMLWWDETYPRFRWQVNALNYKARAASPAATPPPTTLMVTRRDGPTPEVVDRIILSSLKVEKDGLQGQVALDGRGLKGDDGYSRYDKTIRSLAELLQSKTKLKVTFDDKEPLFQPGPEAPRDVAIYCGWYSLRNYVPALQFHEGAVGFHVASSELVSLRAENERGWVRNLLNDGVSATLGPVAEPYLHAFPPADEFFPLLMTGKLTLAEVYWKTTPLTSWMTTCIGDPLYTPYKTNPPLSPSDLPEKLSPALPASAPAAH
jgi:uncharacterized protein (TIGR03790 family)